jgi:hypothetical protein
MVRSTAFRRPLVWFVVPPLGGFYIEEFVLCRLKAGLQTWPPKGGTTNVAA